MAGNKKAVQRTVNRISKRNIAPEALAGKGSFQKRITRAAATLPKNQAAKLEKTAGRDLLKARQRVNQRQLQKKLTAKKSGKR